MSDYFFTLSGDVQNRYLEKIEIINHYDPYTFKKEEFSKNQNDLPEVQFIDIVNYFALTHSFYTGTQMKAFKSLQAYKFYEAGFVLQLNHIKVSEHCVVVGEVKHSQKMNEKALKPWLILALDGTIMCAHCTCMAGLGEVCSHAAAIAFAVLFKSSTSELSCTEKLSVWTVPRTNKSIEPKRIKDIDWGRKLKSYAKKIPAQNIPPLENDSLLNFLKKIDSVTPSAAILSVIQPFAAARVPKVVSNLPSALTNLYDPEYEQYSLEELRSVAVDISITAEEHQAVREETLKQSKSSSWFRYRAGIITASNFKAACRTCIDQPSLSLIKQICYPLKVLFKTKETEYGLQHESIARKNYMKNIEPHHRKLSVIETGLMRSLKNHRFGASPDGLVNCECCGLGCIEIKCPYRLRDSKVDIAKFSKMENSFIVLNKDNKYVLDEKHQYYYQVQLQMYCTETNYCDFVVWSKHVMFINRIYINNTFLEENLQKAEVFHAKVIVPELLSRWFTKSRKSVRIELWCECRSPDNGLEMVRCGNEQCSIQWFHVRCVKIPEIPEGSFWFCKACREIVCETVSALV